MLISPLKPPGHGNAPGRIISHSTTEAELSNIAALPREIQFSILDLYIQKYHDAGREGYQLAKGVLTLLLVCKAWYNYGSRKFYKRVFFGRAFLYFKFAKHLQSENGVKIRKLVKEVVFELYERQGSHEVLESYVIQEIFKLCRRIRTVDLRCKWVKVPLGTTWNTKLAEAMKVYADPVWFIYNHPETSSFIYVQALLSTNLLSFMKNLQRLDLYVEPNPVRLAQALAQLAVVHMTVRVYLQMDDDGDVDYTPEDEGTTTDPNTHLVRPHVFFQIVATNRHLRKLEIVSRKHCKMSQANSSASEEAIEKWIERTEFGSLKVTMSREFPSPIEREYLMSSKRWDRGPGPTRKWLEQMKENYHLLYDHESDDDPSDSEWEQDTHLPTKISNRMFLISPPVSQLGEDL
ncbi:hypothetical protein EV426DRAFT_584732 [Tirmania nivea]|nr:hypothetical protein EV426DRAFT_584732 [Tirmania nivea]